MNAIFPRVAVTALVLIGASASASAADATTREGEIRLEEAPGCELTAARCVICHSLDYIQMNAAVMD